MTSTRQDLITAVRDMFPADRADEIIDDDAFGALLWHVRERCDDTDDEHPAGVLEALTEGDLEFATDGAENPAAFLAARVRDL